MEEEEFHQFYKPKMDRSISNVGVKFQGSVSMMKFQMFLDELLSSEEEAQDFLRVKGALNIQGRDDMFVLQCVHMLKNQNFTKAWPSDIPRENRIIFIGRGMQHRRKMLTDGMMACLVKPLRFDVGDTVLARTGHGEDDYTEGEVLKQWDGMNAYRLKLVTGTEVWAPIDEDHFIKL